MALGVVDVFLGERPADALRDAALHLPFHIGWIDGRSGVLDGGVAHHVDLAGFNVHVDVRDVNGEGVARALRHHRGGTDEAQIIAIENAGRPP